MNITIFGASGSTGSVLVQQSLAEGHMVTAFVRTPGKIAITHENLKVLQGDVKDYASVERAVKGQDAVLSALGVAKPLKSDPVVVDGVKNIIEAMQENVVRRLVYLSFVGVGDSRKDSGFVIRHVIARIVHNEIADHELKEQLIRSSRLDWTIVRPPKLTNGPRTGVYRTGETLRARSFLPMMARADVADFMLGLLTDGSAIGRTLKIMY
jgi:putative NADH-flavin reductase